MKYCEIKKDIYWVGSLDPDLRIFDIIMYTPYGTTYNSYVVKGSEKIALFETVKDKTFPQYLDRLNALNINIENIDYIIVDHTEPDHAGSVAKILDLAPNAKVVGSSCAINFLKQIVNKPFNFIEVKEGDTISLGNKTLKFINAPFLHWPDSIYTYVEEDNILFTCDSFGSHYCSTEIFNDKIENRENYLDALQYYFNMIMGPFKPYMLSAIDKIKDLNIDIICPGHGPILRDNPNEIVEQYKKWSENYKVNNEVPLITICYVSAYGYTEKAAQKILEGIKSMGNFDFKLFDVIHHDMNEVLESISKSDGLLFGTPTINGDALKPIWDILVNLNPIVHGCKTAGAFGSYGWSGEGVPNIHERLTQLRMNLVDPLRFTFNPSEKDLDDCFKFGINFANCIKNKFKELPSKNNTKRWKCIICNEIFEGDTPPEICPACGAGVDQFIEVEEEIISFSSNSEEKFVIVGNGIAGLSAAESIRKRNTKCKITIISSENVITYYRPSLTEALGTEIDFDKFFVKSKSWYDENNIELLLNTKVNSINSSNQILYINNEKEIHFDKLILATGSKNFIPPVDGIDKEGVYTLREITDLENIRKEYSNITEAVVVGGGVLGVEAAVYLKNKGFNVTIIELGDYLMSKQLDETAAKLLERTIKNHGINYILKDSVSSITGTSKVTGIKLNSGKEVRTDLVLFSIGIRPNVNIVNNTDIKTNRGILVNKKMETNIENIYACGDVSEIDGNVYGNWASSIEMGKIAGANAVGDNIEFSSYVNSVVFNEMDLEIFSCGDIKTTRNNQLTFYDENNNIYKKFILDNSIVIGGVLVNDTKKSLALINAIKNKKNYSYLLEQDSI